MIPNTALGRRAANSFTPKAFIDNACSQKNSGGFSQKGSKLMVTLKKSPVSNISRLDSAKFISSQSNKCNLPSSGKKNTKASNTNIQLYGRLRVIS